MIHIIDHNHEYIYSTPTTAPRLATLELSSRANNIRYLIDEFNYSCINTLINAINDADGMELRFDSHDFNDEDIQCFYCKDEKGNNVHVAVREL